MRTVFACLLLLWLFSASVEAQTRPPVEPSVLAEVDLAGPVAEFPLPFHALLQDGAGKHHLLVFATESKLSASRWPSRILARDVVPEDFVIATPMRTGAREQAATLLQPLLDDGRQWIVRAGPEEAEQLSAMGFELQRIQHEPCALPEPPAPVPKGGGSKSEMPDPLVAAMIRAVQTTNLYSLVARFSGVEPVLAGGAPYRIPTRHTRSGLPLTNALQWAFARFEALGLNPAYHFWINSTYSNWNVVAVRPGTTRSNELVLLTAHLDDMPSGATAPGADDNASGSAAVLTAAGICSQYQFERSIQFVLFTGEEQGLLGSAAYAGFLKSNKAEVSAVVNLDMIAWDGKAPPTLQLHTRTAANASFSNDLAIASIFTNVVSAYGLSSELAPVIKADSAAYSDHASFWNKGYPAIVAIEDDGVDFNPYYHTTRDTLSRFNLAYFTAAVRASVATTAHLALPVGRVPVDVLEIASSDWTPGSGLGASGLVLRHEAGAGETSPDVLDLPVTNLPPNPNPRWFEITTQPDGFELAVDSRPPESESLFAAALVVSGSPGESISSSNQLRFDFLTPPSPDRIYLARLRVDPEFTTNGAPFLSVRNLRDLTSQEGGCWSLPYLSSVPAGTTYGTCEIASRFLDMTSASCPLQIVSVTASNLVLSTMVQVGTRIVDEVESSPSLTDPAWTRCLSVTNDVAPEPANFESGWRQLTQEVEIPPAAPGSPTFFRLKRTWLAL